MWPIRIVIGVLSATACASSVAASCLEYEQVSLYGTLVRQTYPGPPDYESVTKGDEPRVIWVLVLGERICVASASLWYPGEYNQKEVQLVLASDQYAQYRHLFGRKVIAKGELLHGGARYEKRLVLIADDLHRALPGAH